MKVFDLGFLIISWVDIIDIVLVTFLLYGIYKIIKGSLALNIFFGFIIVYILWHVFNALEMRLISNIIGRIIDIGALGMIVVFQQEIRRFLLMIGKNNPLNKTSNLKDLLPWNWKTPGNIDVNFDEIAEACVKFSKSNTGALIIIGRATDLQFFIGTGIPIEASINCQLLETIFQKKSPMHDGAVIITDNRIRAAGCILPVTERLDLPQEFGLRHRSAIGISEQSDAIAIIVSEETGKISLATRGEILRNLSRDELAMRFYKEYNEIED
jgi:uncharacterized protein (TIGR00159 family)